MRVTRGFGREAWLWSITSTMVPESGMVTSGDADDQGGARVAFRAALDAL